MTTAMHALQSILDTHGSIAVIEALRDCCDTAASVLNASERAAIHAARHASEALTLASVHVQLMEENADGIALANAAAALNEGSETEEPMQAIERPEYVEVITVSAERARQFFGVPMDAKVIDAGPPPREEGYADGARVFRVYPTKREGDSDA